MEALPLLFFRVLSASITLAAPSFSVAEEGKKKVERGCLMQLTVHGSVGVVGYTTSAGARGTPGLGRCTDVRLPGCSRPLG